MRKDLIQTKLREIEENLDLISKNLPANNKQTIDMRIISIVCLCGINLII